MTLIVTYQSLGGVRPPLGMRATPGGQIVIDHIRRTLRDLERTKTQIEAALGLRFGVVTIAATDSVASSFLPDVLSSFLEKSPGVRFKVSIQRSVDVFETVAAGQAEIGISFGPVVQKGLLVAGSYPLSIGVLVASDHPLAVRESVHIADVVKYPMAIPSSALPLYEEVVNVIRNEVPDYAPWIETDSMDLIKRMVETGRFVAFRTALSLDTDYSSARTVFIPVEGANFPQDEMIVTTRAVEKRTEEASWALDCPPSAPIGQFELIG